MEKDDLVRSYIKDDEEEIVRLLELVFEGWPHIDLGCTPIDHWRWKHQDNPLGKSVISLGINNNKIVGCYHTILQRVKIGNGIFLWGEAVDVVVNPDFRKMGIYKKLLKLRIDLMKNIGINFDGGVIGNPILIKTLSKIYNHFPHSIKNLVKIRDIDMQLRMMPVKHAWFMKLGFKVLKLINDIKNNLGGSKLSNQRIHISEVISFDDRIDNFWEEVSSHYDFIIERRRHYLNWRYCDPRAGDFIVKQAEEDNRILGYSVLKINRYLSYYPVGFVVDLLTLPNRLDAANALVADAVRYFDSNDVNLISYLVVENHPNVRVFNKYDFLDSRMKLHLIYLPLEVLDEINKVKTSSANNIFVSWGDHDVLPTDMPNYR